MKNQITVIILTANESIHLGRCLASVSKYVSRVVVVDSGSDDSTVEIARAFGASVLYNPWVNYSTQFNWALDNSNIDTPWVLRLDADEYIDDHDFSGLLSFLNKLSPSVCGVSLFLRRVFMGRYLRHGSLADISLVRVFRFGHARCESKWMDEHIVVSGEVAVTDFCFYDHNLKDISWWILKHNGYATREAVDVLVKTRLQGTRSSSAHGVGGLRLVLKYGLYLRLPLLFRAFCYFVYRYFFRLGFLDGRRGLVFHFLQGFWYRFLVDVKIKEIEDYAAENNLSLSESIRCLHRIVV